MKKAIVTLSVILLTAVSAVAGGEKPSYYTPKFKQGWFVDLAGTYSVFASNGSAYHYLNTYYGGFHKTNPKHLFGFSGKIGRRVSPSVAVRVGYDWHQSYNANYEFCFKNLHLDIMESPLDLFFGYNPKRIYTMWIYGGIGLLEGGKVRPSRPYNLLPHWKDNLDLGVHGGIMNNFRLSNSFDFHIDLTATAMKWDFDGTEILPAGSTMNPYWHRAHFDFSGMVGLMWYLGGRAFTVVPECEPEVADCSEQEARIQELLKELENCKNGVTTDDNGNTIIITKPCDTVYQTIEGEAITYPFSIFFNKGSYELRDGRDRVNLEALAKVAKEKDYKVTLRGTCDSATASSAFNKTLAENRCRKIKDELTKLGVKESNIIVDAVGGVKELNPTEYDRRVLINLSK